MGEGRVGVLLEKGGVRLEHHPTPALPIKGREEVVRCT
jgi:hypothetical protein